MKRRLNVVVMVVTLLFCFSIGSVSIGAEYGIYNVSKPTYQVTAQYDVKIPMRDGTRLAAIIWKPEGEGKFPVVMRYWPYFKGDARTAKYFAERGYVVVQAEKRGCGNSEGFTLDYFSAVEFQDGYDLVEWVAAQSWSNGKVGMFGGSYGAMMATRTAAQQPPHLVAIAFESEYSNFFGDCFFIGGWRSNAIWAARHMDNITKTMLKGPIYDDPQTGGKMVDLELWKYQVANNNWKNHPKGFWENMEYNEFWMHKDLRSKYDKLKIPMLMIQSYFDDGRFHDGAYINYQVLKEKGIPVKLIAGPWSHATFQGPQKVDREYYDLAWFDYWLKGIDTGIQKEPPISIFVMRENKWRHENEWPIKRTQFVKYYLTPKGNLTKSKEKVIAEVKETKKEKLRYAYKPGVGVAAGFYGAGPTNEPTLKYEEFRVQMDQRRDENDSLTFTTEELRQDMEMTGMGEVEFYASSTSDDTDFCIKISDVLPNGRSELVASTWLNSSYRESNVNPRQPKDWKFVKPTKIVPGQVYKYKYTIQHTSYVFKKGHRIRATISSSDWPTMWPNPNPAENEIHFKNLSYVALPIIPKQSPALPEPKMAIYADPPVMVTGELDCWIEEHLGTNTISYIGDIKYPLLRMGPLGEVWSGQEWRIILPKDNPYDQKVTFKRTYVLNRKDGGGMKYILSSTIDNKNGPIVNLEVEYGGPFLPPKSSP